MLRCYTTESRFDWVSQLLMVEFHYNCWINEASKHDSFEVSYGFQPAIHGDVLLPLTGVPAHVVERLTELANVREIVREL